MFFLWVSGVTNSINWLDGLDGLAISSVVTITSAILCISIFNQNYLQTLILVPLLGASMGFIPHNIMPAKVYMGDGGSYLLGTALSVVSLLGIIDLNLNEVNLIKIFIPLTLLIIPILDMTYVILKG